MNQRDYTIIARGIAASYVGYEPFDPPTVKAAILSTRRLVAERVARELAADDPRFDHQWFLRACGVAS